MKMVTICHFTRVILYRLTAGLVMFLTGTIQWKLLTASVGPIIGEGFVIVVNRMSPVLDTSLRV
jgi:hypothetical protein